MNPDARLTKREAEIAELIAWGASKGEIAARCFISERTVENHCRSIFAKAGVTKATELSAWWFCTSFHLSFDLSPMARKAMAILMLALLIPDTIQDTTAQPTRTEATRICKARRARRHEPDSATVGLEL